MRAFAFTIPLLRLSVLAGFACLAHTVLVGCYTPPTTPPCSTPGRYPVGYDQDRRARPYAPRWAMPVGYDPRRRPPLRPSDTPAGMDPPRTDAGASAYAECIQDPTRHVCTGIWMGRSIIDRRSLDP